jgi:uncharacterized protein
MEAASWFSLTSLVFLLIGAAAGAAAGLFLSPAVGEAKRLRSDLDRLKIEHDAYRASVNSHFRKTADLVGEMTKSYAAVYDHLAGGARRFCDDSGSDSAIPFEPLPGALASPVIEAAADSQNGSTPQGMAGAGAAVVTASAADYAAAEEGLASDGDTPPAYAATEGDYAVAGDTAPDYVATEEDYAVAGDTAPDYSAADPAAEYPVAGDSEAEYDPDSDYAIAGAADDFEAEEVAAAGAEDQTSKV